MSNTTTTKSKKPIKTKDIDNKDNINNDNAEIEIKTDEIQEQFIQPIPTKSYKVIVDIDKDLDLLLICCILNKHNIKTYLEYGETISCGTYSDINNACKVKFNIEALGYKALIQEV